MPHKDPEVRKAYLREYHKRWYAENGDARREQIRDYKLANKDRVAASDAIYRARPEIRARDTEAKRKWRAANPERNRTNSRTWRRANRELVRLYERRSRTDRSEYQRRWRAVNREYIRIRDHIRYIRSRDGVSAEQFQALAGGRNV